MGNPRWITLDDTQRDLLERRVARVMRELLAERARIRCGDTVQVWLYADDLGLGCDGCDRLAFCKPD